MKKIKVMVLIFTILLSISSAGALNSTGKNITISTLSLPTSSSGGGGGSGGGGVVTDEPFTNIAISDRQEKSLFVGRITEYDFKTSVYRIDVDALNNEDDVSIKVEELKARSLRTDKRPDVIGNVYKYINIYAGTKRIGGATIYFTSPGISAFIMRWNPDTKSWHALKTTRIDETHYSARTTGFSNFVIVAGVEVQQPTETTTSITVQTTAAPMTKPTAIPTPEQTPRVIPGFETAFGFLGIIVLYIIRRGK